MEFRRLASGDYDELVRLWRLACLPFKPRGRDGRKSVAMQMKVEPDFLVGAFDGGRMVGVAIISSDMRRGWINRLAVDPESRRRGVGKTLVCECERVLKAHGLRLFCALIDVLARACESVTVRHDRDIAALKQLSRLCACAARD